MMTMMNFRFIDNQPIQCNRMYVFEACFSKSNKKKKKHQPNNKQNPAKVKVKKKRKIKHTHSAYRKVYGA